jgi:hypothetical protein
MASSLDRVERLRVFLSQNTELLRENIGLKKLNATEAREGKRQARSASDFR